MNTMKNKLMAEFFGTLWLVFGGCGSAVLAAHFLSTDPTPVNLGIGFVGVSLAFGLTVMTMAYRHRPHLRLPPQSGGHRRPGGRRTPSEVRGVPYIVAQVARRHRRRRGPLSDCQRQGRLQLAGGFASNGFGEHSPGDYSMVAALVAEIVLTFFFLFIILGATDKRAPQGFAPIAIGLGLTLIHLIGIPVTNLSVNPARSTGPALFVGGWALAQLWLFWVAPIVGAAIAGIVYPIVSGEKKA